MATTVFINEFHYDNDGTDAGEFIEIAGPAGTDLTGWKILLYNGNGGALYDTKDLLGIIPNQANGFGTVVFPYPSNGIQNGAPDGIALVDNNNVVIQFLSYEGSFIAVGGVADGMTSIDIGVVESGSTPLGESLQLTGTGSVYEDFTWSAPASNTSGAVNTGQTFVAHTDNLVDLSTYVRIGRYDLPEPTRTTASNSTSLLAQEASAVTYNPETDTLFVVGDGSSSIVQVTKTGQLIDSMTLAPGGSPQGTEFYDIEGLTYVGNGQFVLTEERDRQANLFTYTPNTTLTRADVQTVKLGTTVGNIGLEGVSYDPATGGFILVKEIDPQGVFQTAIDFAAGTATNGSPITENSVNLFDPTAVSLTDIADVYALSNLDENDNLLLLSQEDGLIINVDRAGNITSSLAIAADPENPLSVTDQGHEGLTMDSNGLLYVVSENGGGDSDHPQLWVYAPSSYAYTNAAPVAVSLSNTTSVLSESSGTTAPIQVGTIVISDDALGTNTLSLTGADADAFEIDGTKLFLKAGTVLDFETKPSYEVMVTVDDGSVGTTPDATTTFTLQIADATENSTLIISEVAPWSSGNSPSVGADWFEVTNTGSTAVDITGWRIDDDSASFANSSALSGITSIAPDQSVIFVDGNGATVTAFVNTWFGGILPSNTAIGTYSGPGLGTGGDAVNLFDATGTLVTGVTFGVSPSASPFATFNNADGLSAVSTLSVNGVNGAYSIIDVGVNEAAVLIGSPGTIVDSPVSPTTLVAIAATDATAAEDGQNPGTFTILRTGDTTAELDVTFTVGGDADAADYIPSIPTTVIIPAGASEATIILTPVDDALAEPTESVTLTLVDTDDYDVAANATSATVTIADNDSAIANFDLQITEIWSGNSVGSNLTADWFELTNIGSEAWVSGVDPDLYYDDDSQDPTIADLISGISQIAPGESVIVVIGNGADAQNFTEIWSPVIDLTGVEVGFTDGAGLGANGDGVSLFVGLPGAIDTPADFEAYPAGSTGQSYDVDLAAFSVAGANGAVATQPNNENEPAVGSPGVIVAENANVFISEFHYDNFGADTGEFIEVTANAGTDLTGYSLVLYNGNDGAAYNTLSLSGVVADQSNGQGTIVVDLPSNGLQNGSPDGIALVDADGNVIEFLSYEGTFTAVGGPADGLTSTDVGVAETGSEPVGQSLQLIDGVWIGPAAATRGEVNTANGGGGTGEFKFIHEIQGTGTATPLAGQVVTVEAIVVGDFQGSTGLSGFYLQEEDTDTDTNNLTSEGIFVFDGNSPLVDVKVGDLVRVTGTATEFFDLTELTSVTSVQVVSSGNSLPTTATINFPVASATDLEAAEGMLVTIPDTLFVTEYFNLDRFGEIRLSSDGPGNAPGTDGRLEQYTQFNTPDVAGYAAYQEQITNRQIVLDDGSNVQNPNTLIFGRGGQPLSSTNTLRGGDTVSGLTGVLSYGFGDYRIETSQGVDFQAVNEQPAAPQAVGGNLKVASLNVLNYFTTLDNGGNTAIGLEPRGANNATEFQRQTEKLVTTILTMDVDVLGLVEIENDFLPGASGNAIAFLVDQLNAKAGSGTYAWVNPGTQFVGDDAIAVGVIYKTASVSIANGTTVEILTDNDLPGLGLGNLPPVFNGPGTNRAPLAVTLEDNSTGGRFTLVMNHLKSKGSAGTAGDADLDAGDGAGFANQTRLNGVNALNAWLGTDPTGSGDADFLLMGDFNAYAMEDPITSLEGNGYTDLAEQFVGAEAYSYLFDGQFGTLDYALANSSLLSQVTGATEWHINADEPDAFDYNLDFNRDPALFDGTDPFRTSDHDPIIIGLNLNAPMNIINGSNRSETLTGTDGNDVITGLRGSDTIVTGGGHDQIVYTSLQDARDRILDFTIGQDQIVLTQLLDAINYNGSNPLADGYVKVASVGRRTMVQFDSDGVLGSSPARDLVEVVGVTVNDLNSTNNFIF